MKTQNKFLKKYLLPYYVTACMSVLFGLTATIVLAHESNVPNKKVASSKNHQDQIIWFLIIVACLFMLWSNTVSGPNETKQKAYKLTQTYINTVMNQYPELRQYKYLLENQEFIKNLTVLICNELNDQEHKAIIKIIQEIDSEYYNTTASEKNIQRLTNQILVIVQKHAQKNPEFLFNIKNFMEKSSKLYILSTQQNVR